MRHLFFRSVVLFVLILACHTADAQLVSRTGPDKVTIAANRLEAPLKVDGRLDEPIYSRVAPITDFIQQEPREGEPATEKTEAWIMFDDKNFYVAARLWDSHPERDVANEMQRDGSNMTGNENLIVVLDTFHDRRNGYFFQANKLGGLRDIQVTDDGQHDSWNGVWDVKTATFDQGWTVEFVFPFKTLRYLSSGSQEWGLNLRRIVKWKNEVSYLSLVPAALGLGGVSRMASAATLVGIEPPAQSMNLELKPYVDGSLTTDHTAIVPFTNDSVAGAGLDVKYGLTRSLIADGTINPDFAQVEEDVQVVNLTRFSVFFPEKRTFFLEGQGIFDFGGVQSNNSPGIVPLMFFSRQIGLSRGQEVPVIAGGRVTGRAGKYTIGGLNIATNDKPEAAAIGTDFTAFRVKRDILRRSYIGVIGTNRTNRINSTGSNSTIGADIGLNFYNTIGFNAYVARTASSDDTTSSGESSYRARFDYTADRYGFSAESLGVGRSFNPEVGYAQRIDINNSYLFGRFSPRPKHSAVIRKFTYQGALTYLTNADRSSVQLKEQGGTFLIDFQNSDQFSVDFLHDYELLPKNFRIAPGVIVPAGGYDYHSTKIAFTFGQQRRLAGQVAYTEGTLYGGTARTLAYSRGRVVVAPRWVSIEPGVNVNWVDLPYGDFTAAVVTARVVVTPSPRMVVSSLIQYNHINHAATSSVRWKWEYTPGSELFVVYSDGRDTHTPGFPDMLNRTFVIKATKLIRF